MILSFRKALDASDKAALTQSTLQATIDSYKRVVQAFGNAGAKAYPPIADEFRASLQQLHQRVTVQAEPAVMHETAAQLEGKLEDWSGQAAGFFDARAAELKDILLIVAETTSDLAARDQRHSKQLQDATEQLRSTLQLNDLASIRQSLTASVAEIVGCVKRLNEEGEASRARMHTQLATYESRLAESEKQASLDSLTGLTNRRALDTELERRAARGEPFAVIFWDLNEFKSVNDRWGHAAGDDLLKQVSTELKGVARIGDLVGRWGGDEFIVILDGELSNAEKCAARIDQWVAGTYALKGAEEKLDVAGALGIAAWEAGETIADLLARADAAMYARKAEMKKAGPQQVRSAALERDPAF